MSGIAIHGEQRKTSKVTLTTEGSGKQTGDEKNSRLISSGRRP